MMSPYRSAETGEYVDERYAKAHPDTTVWEDEETPKDEASQETKDTPQVQEG